MFHADPEQYHQARAVYRELDIAYPGWYDFAGPAAAAEAAPPASEAAAQTADGRPVATAETVTAAASRTAAATAAVADTDVRPASDTAAGTVSAPAAGATSVEAAQHTAIDSTEDARDHDMADAQATTPTESAARHTSQADRLSQDDHSDLAAVKAEYGRTSGSGWERLLGPNAEPVPEQQLHCIVQGMRLMVTLLRSSHTWDPVCMLHRLPETLAPCFPVIHSCICHPMPACHA